MVARISRLYALPPCRYSASSKGPRNCLRGSRLPRFDRLVFILCQGSRITCVPAFQRKDVKGIQCHFHDVICCVIKRRCVCFQPLPGLLRNSNYRHCESRLGSGDQSTTTGIRAGVRRQGFVTRREYARGTTIGFRAGRSPSIDRLLHGAAPQDDVFWQQPTLIAHGRIVVMLQYN